MTSRMRHVLFRRTSQLIIIFVALYSTVHFGHTVARTRCMGDFIQAFPGAFVATYNPQLCEEIWSIYGIEVWGRAKPVYKTPDGPGGAVRSGLASVVRWPGRVVVLRGHEYMLGEEWNYGPLFHFITLPLTWLPNMRLVCLAWTFCNLIFLGITAVLVYRMVAPSRANGIFTMVYLALWSNFFPLSEVLRQANIEIVEFMLVVLACAWFKRYPVRSGSLLGVAAMTKFLPLIFLPYAAMKKAWKVLAAGLVTVVIIASLTEPLLTWGNNRTMRVFGSRPEHLGWVECQSLSSLIARAFAKFPDGLLRTSFAVLTEENTARALGWFGVACGVCLLVGLWVLWKTRATLIADFSLLVSAMIFLPVWNHTYYQVFLLLPFSFLLGKIWQAPSLTKWTLLAACYLATCSLIVPLSVVDALLHWGTGYTSTLMHNLSLPAWANLMVILWLIKERFGPAREEPLVEL